jgi:hypothetical protein
MNESAQMERSGLQITLLPGWIVGTAGAIRYRLPNGDILFAFKEAKPSAGLLPRKQNYCMPTAGPNGPANGN